MEYIYIYITVSPYYYPFKWDNTRIRERLYINSKIILGYNTLKGDNTRIIDNSKVYIYTMNVDYVLCI